MIDLLLLGNGAMMPLPDRWLSSLLVKCEGEMTLFDCGEGTQIPWKRFGWGFRRLAAICLTHMHADHVAGLPGVLHSVAHANRTDPLLIVGPAGTIDVVTALRAVARYLPYEIEIREVEQGDTFDLPGGLTASVISGDHQIPCNAYRIDLPRAREFLAQEAEQAGIPLNSWSTLQDGLPVEHEGDVISPEDYLGPPRRGLSIGFVTDTRPTAAMPAFFSDVDLLVCEGTYGDSADQNKAFEHRHMTFREAATLARRSNARSLWLTHFSPGMPNPDDFLSEATSVFPATRLGYSGLTESLAFD